MLRTKISQENQSMKNKERSWALTKEDPILEVKKDHEGPKSQKEEKRKEIIINKKKEDLGQARGYVARILVRGYAARRVSRP